VPQEIEGLLEQLLSGATYYLLLTTYYLLLTTYYLLLTTYYLLLTTYYLLLTKLEQLLRGAHSVQTSPWPQPHP
jgi:hypothetical protein